MFSLSTGVVSGVSSIVISSIAVAKEFFLNGDGRIGDPKTAAAGGYHGRECIVIFAEMPSPRVSLSAVCVVEGRSCEWGCVS